MADPKPKKRVQRKQRAAHLGPERRRPMVLDAALKLFSEQGYERTSMDNVAEAIGVTKPVVYECFANKLVLFEALLDREERRLMGVMDSLVPKDSNGRVKYPDDERMISILVGLYQSVVDYPDSWNLLYLTEHGTASEVANRIERGRKRQVALTYQIVSSRFKKMGIKKDIERKSTLFSHILVGLGDGLIRMRIREPGDFTADELGNTVASMMFAGEQTFDK